MDGEHELAEKLMVAERALFDDRNAFNGENPDLAEDFKKWQDNFRTIVRAKEAMPALNKSDEHRPLMLWMASLLHSGKFPGSDNPALNTLRKVLPDKPNDDQLLQFLRDAFQSDIAQFEGALEKLNPLIAVTAQHQEHCRQATELRVLQDVQTMYVEFAQSNSQIISIQKQIDELKEGHPDAADTKAADFEERQNEDAQLRDLRRNPNDSSAVLSRELQGTWVLLLSIANDGTEDRVMVFGPSIHFDQDAGWLTMDIKREPQKFTYAIDATKPTAEIDLKFAEGIESLGLIELKDGTLSLRLGDVNEKRPESMTSKESTAKLRKYHRVEDGESREPMGFGPLYDDRQAFNATNTALSNDFQQWQRDYRNLLRAKEILTWLTQQPEHRALMLGAAEYHSTNRFSKTQNPTLEQLHVSLPAKPSEEQLLQFLLDVSRTGISDFETALKSSTIKPTQEQQSHCHDAELLRTIQDIQSLYIDVANHNSHVSMLQRYLDHTGAPM